MKYMGSKRLMLQNGLGKLLLEEASEHERFIDLFSGSSAVSNFIALQKNIPVHAVDLQTYSSVLSASIIERTKLINSKKIFASWLENYNDRQQEYRLLFEEASRFDSILNIPKRVKQSRSFAKRHASLDLPIFSAYGGHYFSLSQALTVDFLMKALPEKSSKECLASLIISASQCVASPGHTAQPFQPTPTASPYIEEAWEKSILYYTEIALRKISSQKAQAKGKAVVDDAVLYARKLKYGDLVFIDPPYSGVHYSRFYHVLETIARGSYHIPEGTGRYPSIQDRPSSSFSKKSEAFEALQNLLNNLATTGSTVVFTFPNHDCSNGLSGNLISEVASQWFEVKNSSFTSKFSTLGGNNSIRSARKKTEELILLLKPR